jgi:1,4-alpha-glucan branching enzyme
MNLLEEIFNFIGSKEEYISTKHEDDKVIVFEKGVLLFVFNFHPVKSFEGYQIGTKWGSKHKIILDSDEERFMGKGRLKAGHDNLFPCIKKAFHNRPYNMKVYLPSRTCMVLIAEENIKKYDISKLEL